MSHLVSRVDVSTGVQQHRDCALVAIASRGEKRRSARLLRGVIAIFRNARPRRNHHTTPFYTIPHHVTLSSEARTISLAFTSAL